jgi:hypothetical protein
MEMRFLPIRSAGIVTQNLMDLRGLLRFWGGSGNGAGRCGLSGATDVDEGKTEIKTSVF